MGGRRVFHVDLDAFFVAVERALDPSLEGRPVVVGGDPGARGVVACASYEARRYGLRAGMPLRQAQRLCPHAVFLPGRYERYAQVSARFHAILAEYSPLVEPLGLDEAFVEMTGTERLLGPAAQVAREVRERVRRECRVTASIGIAGSKVTAKVASDACKPDGLLEVPPGEDATFLAPLPVGQVPGIGPRTVEELGRLGVRTVGELARVPPGVLRRRFGVYGVALHRWATGQDDTPVRPPEAPKSISRETTFPEDTADRPFLLATLRYLAERVGAEVRQEGMRARCVVVKVRYGDFHTVSRQRALAEPVADNESLYRAGEALLLRALAERPMRVRLIGIGVSSLVAGATQLALLDGGPWLRHERLAQALDRVRAKYGFAALQTGRTLLLRQHFPEERRGFVLKTPALSR